MRDSPPTPLAESTPLRLRLRVRHPDHSDHDLVIEADRTTPVARVLAECDQHLAARERWLGDCRRGYSPRLSRHIDPQSPVSTSGLVDGDLLVLEPAGGSDEVALQAASVDDAGAVARISVAEPGRQPRVVNLSEGRHTVGRADGCDVLLDDPEVSRAHATITVGRTAVHISDLGSSNGVRLDGQRVQHDTAFPVGASAEIGPVRFDLVAHTPPAHTDGELGTVPFNRPPRVARAAVAPPAPLEAPPSPPRRSRIPMATALAPVALGLAIYFITDNVMMLLFLALSPVIALASWMEDRRGGRSDYKRDAKRWRAALGEFAESIVAARREEERQRHDDTPTFERLRDTATARTAGLWERRPAHGDFLRLRLGTADLPSAVHASIEPGGADVLRKEAEQAVPENQVLHGVPATILLAELNVLGLCGTRDEVGGLARSLVAQAAAMHAPGELVVAAGIAKHGLDDWDWLKWLPHTLADDPTSPWLTRDTDEAERLIARVQKIADDRVTLANERFGTSTAVDRHILLVLDERLQMGRSDVTRLLDAAGGASLSVIWLGGAQTDLPGNCDAIVAVDRSGGAFAEVATGRTVAPITVETLASSDARGLAIALAPVREVDARTADAGIPTLVRLPPLLGTDAIGVDDIVAAWSAPLNGLGAPVGVGARGPFEIDLERDGPHALVAGTTGAGKSELLLALIGGLVAKHPPSRLNLLLIDYKGGAAFKDCVDLPHTVGFFTDLDAGLAARALVSLNAELRRREHILEASGCKDLAQMRAERDDAPASLLIVVDEFATLVNEVPDFVDGIVDVAQRGRSLGVHMVLATQRPSGVVGPNVRANTNLRIALRVQEPSDSEDVIGSQDATRISPAHRGRAIARIAGSSAEFQSAYVGARPESANAGNRVVVRDLVLGGPPPGPSETIIGVGDTDLKLLAVAARGAATRMAIPEQPAPWLPPLPPLLDLFELPHDGEGGVAIGMLDEPAAQRQRPLTVDLDADGSFLIYGAGAAGSTTTLRTIATALADAYPVERLHIYALDFSTGVLRGLDALPHCGGVILKDEPERVERLFKRLSAIIARRKARPDEPRPHIVVLLDDYAGFAAAYERVLGGEMIETFMRLVADGRSLGVHFSITANRRSDIPMQLSGLVSWRLVLAMVSDEEFEMLGVSVKSLPSGGLPPGRGLLGGRTLAQVAVVGGRPDTERQIAAIADLGDRLSRRGPERAPGIGVLPAEFPFHELPQPSERLRAAFGIGDDLLEPVAADASESHFLVVGPYRSGRSTALAALAMGLADDAELHLLAPRRSPLTALDLWASSAEGIGACTAAAARLRDEIALRTGHERPLVLVVDNAEEVVESGPAPALEVIARRGRDLGVRIIAGIERQATRRAFGGWIVELRKEENGLLLDPDLDMDGEMLGARLPRGAGRGLPPGRGYLVSRGDVELVQTALTEVPS